jgi:hypothetical protein
MARFGFPVFPYRTTGESFRSAGAGDAICRERGLLRGRGKQRTNSTPILVAIRTLDRLELVGDTVRFTSNRLAAVALVWLQTHLQPVWLERYGARVENYRLPKTETERQRLAATIGADGFALLQAVYASGTPPEVRTEPRVGVGSGLLGLASSGAVRGGEALPGDREAGVPHRGQVAVGCLSSDPSARQPLTVASERPFSCTQPRHAACLWGNSGRHVSMLLPFCS